MNEGHEDEIVFDREMAAALALVLSVSAMVVGVFFQVVAVVIPMGALGIGLGFWAAARGERAVLATFAIAIGLAAIVISVIWAVSVD